MLRNRTELLPRKRATKAQQLKKESASRSQAKSVVGCYVVPLLPLWAQGLSKPEVQSFEDWSYRLGENFAIAKIAEASFGEVYRMRVKSPDQHPSLTPTDESVLKVIPLKPAPQAAHSGEKTSKAQLEREAMMSPIDAVVSEVQLLHRMTDIPGFVNFRELCILQGRPSDLFISAWHEYNSKQRRGDKSLFPDPAKRASYSEQQLWAVLEMQDAGIDLEKVKLPTVFHVWDVFWKVAVAVAKAETECRFEHRDLHLGNICVRAKRTGCKPDETKVRVSSRRTGYTELEATIIDYTYSRADMSYGKGGKVEEKNVKVAFQDLAKDKELFLGDAAVNYQYEMYRCMHSAFYHYDPGLPYDSTVTSKSEISWRGFQPLTNVVWLHFILHTLLASLELWPSTDMEGTLAFLRSGDREMAERRARRLERTLKGLRKTLRVENLGTKAKAGPTSAEDLVWLALQEKWIDEIDIVRY